MDNNIKQKEKTIIILDNNKELINRYGEAIHEYIKAYTGYQWENKETGQSGFAKGHKQVAQSKINSQYKEQNIKQQAGFSAEIDIVAKTNADNIINNSAKRISRSNDVGRGNDIQVDIGDKNKYGNFIFDKNGNVQNGIQIKFSGKYSSVEEIKQAARRNVNRMRPKGIWSKYKYIAVPSEQYEPMKIYASEQSQLFKNQANEYQKKGNYIKAKELRRKAKEYKDCIKKIRNTGISSQEAVFARKHPILHTTKRIGQTAHSASIEQLPRSVLIEASILAAYGAIDVIKGEKTIAAVSKDITIKSLKRATDNYSKTLSIVILKGILQNSKNGTVKTMAKTNMPAIIINGVTEVSRSFKRFIYGEINELELAEELGKKGVGMIALSLGAVIGTAYLPVVGTIVGSTLGYMVSSVLYQGAMKVYMDEKLSLKRKKSMYLFVRISNDELAKSKYILENEIKKKYQKREYIFKKSFSLIEEGNKNNNFGSFIKGMNKIVFAIGETLEFKNFNDIDRFMNSSKKLKF